MKNSAILVIFFLAVMKNLNAQCWEQVSAGSFHTVALKSDGSLWAWGLRFNNNVASKVGYSDNL